MQEKPHLKLPFGSVVTQETCVHLPVPRKALSTHGRPKVGYTWNMSESAPDVPEGSEQLDIADEAESLVDRGVEDPLDEGYSPPENWSAGERFGNTPYEELVGETLDQRLEQEEPEVGDDDFVHSDEDRSGRLVEAEGASQFAEDIGIDGGAASAEEAAVHIIED